MAFKSCKVVDEKEDAALRVLKVVQKEELTQNPITLAKMESVFLSKQKNPHIVEHFESFETPHLVCSVIGYCEHGDLANYEQKYGRLS